MKDFSYNYLSEKLNRYAPRSAWSKGVKEYAFDLLDEYEQAVTYMQRDANSVKELEKWMLNGATSWHDYSWGGCSLIYDFNIAQRLCTPSELKRTRNGRNKPNKREEWLDTQARALYQAFNIFMSIYADDNGPVIF